MKNFKRYRPALIALIVGWAGFAYADGELTTTSSTGTEDLGNGNFSQLPFKVTATVRGGYDDNITTSGIDQQGSPFTNVSVGLNYDFGSPRTTLGLQLGGGFTYYWDKPENVGIASGQDYDVNGSIGFTIEHKASARLTLAANIYATYQTEPDFGVAGGLNRRSGNFFYTADKFSVSYQWAPRFTTTTSYTFGALVYEEESIGLFEDHIENTFGNEFKFLLAPTTSLVAEYRFGLVNYTHEGDVIAPAVPAHLAIVHGMLTIVPALPPVFLQRDSQTHYALGGFDHSFNPDFNVSVRAGVQFREYIDFNQGGFDENQTSPYFEGTVNYAVGKNTSVSWTNRYAIEEGEVLLNPSRTTFRTGLTAKHSFTPKISASLAAYYEHDDYDSFSPGNGRPTSPGFTEDSLDFSISARYELTRYLGIEAGYSHTEVWTDFTPPELREYSRNRYWGGINVTF